MRHTQDISSISKLLVTYFRCLGCPDIDPSVVGSNIDPAIVGSSKFKILWQHAHNTNERFYAKPLIYTTTGGKQLSLWPPIRISFALMMPLLEPSSTQDNSNHHSRKAILDAVISQILLASLAHQSLIQGLI
jgi:hypothetical protein